MSACGGHRILLHQVRDRPGRLLVSGRGKWLELLKQIVPRAGRAGALFNPQTHTGPSGAQLASGTLCNRLGGLWTGFCEQIEARGSKPPMAGIAVISFVPVLRDLD